METEKDTTTAVADRVAARQDAVKTASEDLIDLFEFEHYARKIRISDDRRFIAVSGGFKPVYKVFDCMRRQEKFSRGIPHDILDFALLEGDWTKIAVLQKNSAIEFHGRGEIYARIKLPVYGQTLDFDRVAAELLVGGAYGTLHTLSLEYGKYASPIETGMQSINTIVHSTAHGMRIAGGSTKAGGRISFIDGREGKAFRAVESHKSVSAADFDPEGIYFAAGHTDGTVRCFDIRSETPLFSAHVAGEISKLEVYGRRHILAAGLQEIALFDYKTETCRKILVDPVDEINDFARDGGLLHVCYEAPVISSLIVPELGKIPQWAVNAAAYRECI